MVYKLQLVIASLKFLSILNSIHIFFNGINLLEKPCEKSYRVSHILRLRCSYGSFNLFVYYRSLLVSKSYWFQPSPQISAPMNVLVPYIKRHSICI